MFKLAKVLKGFKPIIILNSEIILARGNTLYVSDLELSYVKYLCSIETKRYQFRLLERIYRSELGSAVQINEDTILIQVQSKIFRVNIYSGQSHLELDIPLGRKLMSFCSIQDNVHKRNIIYFGEYFNNPNKGEVNIWKRIYSRNPTWQIVYTFDYGKINHVHRIFFDKNRNGFFLLTGDFGDAASIWFATNDFFKVEKLFYGSQEYRSCSINEVDSNTFFYLTDTQLEENRLMWLKFIDDKWNVEKGPIVNGPCIYSGKTSKYFIFSTTVEPGASSGSPIRDIFNRKKSSAIFNNMSYIYLIDNKLIPSVVFHASKDYMPFILGQFGTFTFPEGVTLPDRFFSYGIAVNKFDNSCLLFKLESTEIV